MPSKCGCKGTVHCAYCCIRANSFVPVYALYDNNGCFDQGIIFCQFETVEAGLQSVALWLDANSYPTRTHSK